MGLCSTYRLTAGAGIVAAASLALAMPPLNGSGEPNYPPGVNQPSQRLMARDHPNLEGDWNCLVILVDFSDYPWDYQDDENFPNSDRYYTRQHYADMLFSEGEYRHPGAESEYTGSMRDYYLEVSSGVFGTVGVVTEWLRAPQPLTYYCNNDREAGTDDDFGFGDYPHNVQRLVEDALGLADRTVDFSEFDNDGDHRVDALFVIHAGPGAEIFGQGEVGADYIWSHKWSIRPQQRDGMWVADYTMEPEDGTIGVFCHEFGHALGLPDLYDTDYSSEGVGEWCLMGSGGWCHRPGDPRGTCPSHMSGWAKMQLEWVEVINVTERMVEVNIPPVETDAVIYRLWSQGADSPEYFLVEHRRRIGFDAGLTRRQVERGLAAPAGLLITHIDDNLGANDDESHRWVDAVEASPVFIDGQAREHLDGRLPAGNNLNLYFSNRGDDGDLWPGFSALSDDSTEWIGERNRTRFSFNTTPSSRAYDGNPTLVTVEDIRLQGDDISATLDVTPPRQPLLFITGVQIDDSEGGNANGRAESAETVAVTVSVGNRGLEETGELEAFLFNLDEKAQVEHGRASYPSIHTDRVATPDHPFQVIISPDLVGEDEVLFALSLISAAGDTTELTFALPVNVELQWVKYPDNPVLAGSPDLWDGNWVTSPTLAIVDGSLTCWFVGGRGENSGVGMAWSDDGGITWRRRAQPVLQPGAADWVGEIIGLDVQVTDGGYLMAILTRNPQNSTVVIGTATSRDGETWEASRQPAITPGMGWVDELLPEGQVSLFPIPGIGYGCAFSATGLLPFPVITLAVTPDLANWSTYDLALAPTFNPSDFDYIATFAPGVRAAETGYEVLYAGLGADEVIRLGLASVDLQGHLARERGEGTGGSILEPGGDGSWGESDLIGGRVFWWEGEKRILFAGKTDTSVALGLAVLGGFRSLPETRPVFPPASFSLSPAYPNPFNRATALFINSLIPQIVRATVCDLTGREIAVIYQGPVAAGAHRLIWSSTHNYSVPSGVYLVRVTSGADAAARKVMLVK